MPEVQEKKNFHLLLEILPDPSSPMGMSHCHQLVAPINLSLIYSLMILCYLAFSWE